MSTPSIEDVLAAIKAQALREAAEALLAETTPGSDGFDRPDDARTPTVFAIWLQARADAIANKEDS